MAKTINIIGTKIDNITLDEAVSTIGKWIDSHDTPRYVVTPNVDHVVRLPHNNEFRNIYQNADLVLADGMPLLWAAKFLGTPLLEKVSGSDLFVKFCETAARKKYRLFFLGGNPGDAQKAKEVLVRQNPGLLVVGVYCPLFGFEKDEQEGKKIVDLIKAANPDILFVGLGSPKQEQWIYEHYQKIKVPVSIGIGISFSFAAGTIKRAPVWMQKAGLEWFWRTMMEPRRLWKRYFVDDMKFFGLVLKQKLL
ncbi:MAG: WecB/TagA/CpsF family glycosyltransferase [Sedimentisphaerales bacterium]|nr:WecB/TagA/CpsF family glycosyltransferase [Sedimentisphaerales bacterium]